MKFLRTLLDRQARHFGKGGRLERLYPLYEALDGFSFTTAENTTGSVHVRDVIDLKRMMITVFFALVPCTLMALYNTGLQANRALARAGAAAAGSWQRDVLAFLGAGFDPGNAAACIAHGALYFLPVYAVTLAAGGFWEVLFASARRHEVQEGFLVTSLLFPLVLPPTIPYWQVALGISFGVVIGKEVFGGVGRNVFNPALVGRAFLFFAYPGHISGDAVWVAVDGVSQATPLALLKDPLTAGLPMEWMDAFLGLVPGSMGETSTLACLAGAALLVVTGIGSWRIMAGVTAGAAGLALAFNAAGSAANPMSAVPPHWHFVLGGFAFGAVFMATDPVSAALTRGGQWCYGVLIGAMTVMIRVLNPAYPEGMMLSILFGNAFAPILDRLFVDAHIRRRLRRYAE